MAELLDGRYQILKKIGSGGMAIVYLAKDLSLDRYVAIKVLRDEYTEDDEFRRHFQKEAVAIAKLAHNNIVGIYDILLEQEAMCLVMEYVEGETLKQKLNREGPLPWKRVVKYGIQIANGLAYAHTNQIIHKDVKSQNILIDHHDNVKITDFGISQTMNNTTITHNKGVLGSAHYFSPEQARGERLSYETDIYSLGIVLYELLTGELPFTGENPVTVALKHIQEKPQPLNSIIHDVPDQLNDIILKCLEKNPENRYSSMQELSKALSSVSFTQSLSMIDTQIVRDSGVQRSLPNIKNDIQSQRSSGNSRKTNKNETRGKSKKGPSIVLLALIVLIVLGITVFIGSKIAPPSELTAPQLIGMTVQTAENTLSRSELNLVVGGEEYSDDYDAGEIISQSPEKGKNVKKGDTITVIVSKGNASMVVPDLSDRTLDEAKKLLKENNLELGNVTETYSSTVAAGKIISQSIGANKEVKKGTAIDLQISLGEESYSIVPYVVGYDINTAKGMLEQSGLSIGQITYQASDNDSNQVIKQSISSGSKVDEYTTIDLVVSSGKPDDIEEDKNSSNNDGQINDSSSDNQPNENSNHISGNTIPID